MQKGWKCFILLKLICFAVFCQASEVQIIEPNSYLVDAPIDSKLAYLIIQKNVELSFPAVGYCIERLPYLYDENSVSTVFEIASDSVFSSIRFESAIPLESKDIEILSDVSYKHYLNELTAGRKAEDKVKYLLIGGLLIVSFIAFIIFINKKDILYLFYCIYSFSGFALLISQDLIISEVLLSKNYLPDFHLYIRVPEFLQMVGLWAYIMFVNRLLDLKRTHKRISQILQGLAITMLFWGFLEAVVLLYTKDEVLYRNLIGLSSAFLFPLFIGVIFWLAVKVKHPLIKYVVASNTIFILVLLSSFIRVTFFSSASLSPIFDQVFSLPFATFVEVIVFGFALAAKIESANDQLIENEKELASLEMAALRSQMNPHFIFNSMNSIRNLILLKENVKAESYLVRFSKLLRRILNNSRKNTVTLLDELETLQLYIEIEKSRFDNDFVFSLVIDLEVELEMIQVPPLILQPFVENALLHGLKNSDRFPKELSIKVAEESDGVVHIKIYDNGIGRDKSSQLQKNSEPSYGTLITQERLVLYSKAHAGQVSFDIYDEEVGTLVLIKIT